MNEEKAGYLIKLARDKIDRSKEVELDGVDPELKEKRGVFVTLKTYPNEKLKGCIGLPMPRKTLYKAVMDAAERSAYSDPRFPPLDPENLDSVLIELSVLTKPETIESEDPVKEIEIGSDGLIISKGASTGLLLPQVASERGWDPEKFLKRTCRKAGLSQDAWKDEKTQIKKFQAEVFAEEEPRGEVTQKLS